MASVSRSDRGRARREEILQTAMKVFAREGYRNTSMRAIGRELQIEPAHILYYFRSRENLLQEVIERWDATAREEAAGGFEPENALDTFVARLRANDGIPGLTQVYLTTVAESADPEHAAHAFFTKRFTDAASSLAAAIRYEQGIGVISAALDPEIEARRLTALSDGLQLQAMFDPTIDAPAELKSALDVLRSRAT